MILKDFYGRVFVQKQGEKSVHSQLRKDFEPKVYVQKIKQKSSQNHLKGV